MTLDEYRYWFHAYMGAMQSLLREGYKTLSRQKMIEIAECVADKALEKYKLVTDKPTNSSASAPDLSMLKEAVENIAKKGFSK